MLRIVLATSSGTEDPITAFFTHDWASVGGWSLFVGLGLFLVVNFFAEGIVPGRRYRRLETSAKQLSDANDKLITQNGQLITANEITKYFFEETTPKRGVTRDMAQPAGAEASEPASGSS